MLHFNQMGWFRKHPDNIAYSGADAIHDDDIPSIPLSNDNTIPIPSTAKEYYLAKMADLVGEDSPIEAQLSKAVIPIVKKASVEFIPIDPEEFPDAPEGALMATYTFSEEENTILESVHSYANQKFYFVPLALVNGATSALLEKSDPSFPIDGFEFRPSKQGLEFFTGMSSSGAKVIDFFVETEVEPQPKTREEYYLADRTGVLIVDMSWKWGDVRLSLAEIELALDELDPDDSGLNRWPHGTASFTAARIIKTNKIIVNGDQEAAYLVDDDGPIPESGYAFKKNVVKNNNVIRADITIWHMGSTDVTEAINFDCFERMFIPDIPKPKTRSEAYDYKSLNPVFVCPEPLTSKEFYKWMIATHSEPPIETRVLFDGIGEVTAIDLPNALDDQTTVQRNVVSVMCLLPEEALADSPLTITLDGNVCREAKRGLYGLTDPYYYDIVDEDRNDDFIIVRILLPNSDQSGNHHARVELKVYAGPKPKTRTEIYYANLARLYDGELPNPKTPTEFYLATQAGWVPTADKVNDGDLDTHKMDDGKSENDGTN